MRTIKELLSHIDKGIPLAWNDPDPIQGNDYTICHIEDLDDEEWDEHTPILVQYNGGGSEAQVFLHEIIKL